MVSLMVFLYVVGALYTLGVFLDEPEERKRLSLAARLLSAAIGIVFWPVFLGYIRG